MCTVIPQLQLDEDCYQESHQLLTTDNNDYSHTLQGCI